MFCNHLLRMAWNKEQSKKKTKGRPTRPHPFAARMFAARITTTLQYLFMFESSAGNAWAYLIVRCPPSRATDIFSLSDRALADKFLFVKEVCFPCFGATLR